MIFEKSYSFNLFPDSLQTLFRHFSQNLSLNEIARRADLDPAYLCRLKQSKMKNPGIKTLRKIAKEFSVQPKYFIEYKLYLIEQKLKDNPELMKVVSNIVDYLLGVKM